MARFFFAWELGAGLGHVTVIQPLAKRLVERGHEVWTALRDTASWPALFAATGIRCLPAPALGQKPRQPIRHPSTFAHILHNTGFAESAPLAGMVAAWRGLFDLVQPDLLLADHSPTALLAARCAGLKSIPMGIPFSIPVAGRACPDWRPALKNDPEQLAREEEAVLARANECLGAARVPGLGHISDLYGPAENAMLMTFPELDPFAPREGARYWGTISSGDGAPIKWPRGAGPKVFAYLKPFAGLKNLLRVLAGSKARAVIHVGGLPAAARGTFRAGNVALAERPVDLASAARECDLGITMASHGATAALLLAGKPVLMFPQHLEQRLTAECVVRLGAGLAAKPREPRHIASRLERLVRGAKWREEARSFAQRYAGHRADRSAGQATEQLIRALEFSP